MRLGENCPTKIVFSLILSSLAGRIQRPASKIPDVHPPSRNGAGAVSFKRNGIPGREDRQLQQLPVGISYFQHGDAKTMEERVDLKIQALRKALGRGENGDGGASKRRKVDKKHLLVAQDKQQKLEKKTQPLITILLYAKEYFLPKVTKALEGVPYCSGDSCSSCRSSRPWIPLPAPVLPSGAKGGPFCWTSGPAFARHRGSW